MSKVFALLLCAALPATALAAPNTEPLKLNADNKLYCNAQTDWCVGIKTDGAFGENGPFATSRTLRADYRFWDSPDVPDFKHFTVWPELIRLSEERALVGVVGPAEPDFKASTPFSGGGFERRDLYLYDVNLGEQTGANLVLVMPYTADASIRACFNEADQEKRAGQCSDVYQFTASLKALPGKELPDLQVQTQATRSPAGASRFADSSARPALTKAQLAPQADKQCSYTVTYTWKASDASYQPATPLPDCAEFLSADPAAKK
ncbi:hypothetical protein [Achromobacter sp. Root565]|uniref:hypothetical protein n=1 Tax=Achromobacter sp. Root565 TaxID=1736564 RepID=UPI0006F21D19|nr:hypothetical protein [Achromobacter sp. Root565]KRA00645.1 hypothetical protein ASD71_00545 [Achromobacter sp. Root565]